MQRHDVARTGRIIVTEKLVSKFSKENQVLEIGAGDYSFDYCSQNSKSWIKADFEEPADVLCDFNQEELRLPFKDNKFDLIICTEVIEHLLWPQSILKEFHRILNNGGILILSVPNVVSLTYRVAWMLGRIPSCAAAGNLPNHLGSTSYEVGEDRWIGGHVVDFNKKKLIALLKFCNLEALTWHSCGITWHKQLVPYWLIPASLSSALLCVVQKNKLPVSI
jgi:SAM-dependent methyltransferase